MLRPLIRAVTRCAFILTLIPTAWAQSDPASDPAAGGHALPAPFGLGLTVYSQTQDYKLAGLDLGIPGFETVETESLPVANRTDSFHLKLDYWVLPFLNLYAIGGRLETTTTVRLSGVETGLPFRLENLRIENDGWVYGGGLTMAGGWDQWFATLAVTYTEADLEVTDGSVEAWVLTPKLGYTLSRGAVWVGAMYQDTEERHKGTYNVPLIGDVPFEVVLGEATAWNGLVGGTAGLTDHLVLIIEAGFGARQHTLLSLEYRF